MASHTEPTEPSYQLFPGCTIQNRIPFIEKSAKFVFDKIGIAVHDNPEFGCCPDPVGVQSTDRQSWLTLGARNLALAEEKEESIISLCNGCTETLKAVKIELKHNQHEREIVQQRLETVGKSYAGKLDVLHFVEFLHDTVGIERIKSLVTHPLTGMKIAIHPGCHYSRPAELVKTDDPMEPVFQKEILRALGAKVVDYEEEDMCCGSGVMRNNEAAALGMLKRKYESLDYSKADFLAVNCPSCFQQLEQGQRLMKKKFEFNISIPILYITELMALAFGATSKEMGMQYHMVKPKKVLKKFGFE